MNRIRSISMWSLVIIAVSIFFWIKESSNNQGPDSVITLPEDPPDVYITGLDLTRFDAEGHAFMTTQAETLSVYEERGMSFMTRPFVTLENEEESTWSVKSNDAVLYKNEDIEFIENVVVTQLNATPPLVITSQFIKVTNNGDLIVTDQAVEITRGKQFINAIGMEIKLDTIKPIVNLLSEVSFTYDPS